MCVGLEASEQPEMQTSPPKGGDDVQDNMAALNQGGMLVSRPARHAQSRSLQVSGDPRSKEPTCTFLLQLPCPSLSFV